MRKQTNEFFYIYKIKYLKYKKKILDVCAYSSWLRLKEKETRSKKFEQIKHP